MSDTKTRLLDAAMGPDAPVADALIPVACEILRGIAADIDELAAIGDGGDRDGERRQRLVDACVITKALSKPLAEYAAARASRS